MTLLDQLKQLPDQEWRSHFCGIIRNQDGCCPLVALARYQGRESSEKTTLIWWKFFPISQYPDAQRIANAADDPRDPLRKTLEAALGIQQWA